MCVTTSAVYFIYIYNSSCFHFHIEQFHLNTLIFMGPSWSWSYGSWIYNYFCNQCLSPLNLRKIAPIMASIKIAFYVYYLSIISPGMHVYVYYMFFCKITSRKLFKISFLRCSHMGTLCAKTSQWRPLQVAPRARALLAIPWIRHWLWVRTRFMARCTRYNIMWYSSSVTCDMAVVFSGYSGFLHQ